MLATRFQAKFIVAASGCWLWTACCFTDGYPAFSFQGRSVRAHRHAYEQTYGEIPAGLVIDHLCRNHQCVNPAHLEAVTQRENIMRGVGPAKIGAFYAAKTHCPRGHEYSEENTLRRNGQRQCRACNRLRMSQNRTRDRMARGVEGTHQI